MDKKPIVLLQQRDFGQKMNVSFQFVIQNFVPLLKSILLIAGPVSLIAGLATGQFLSMELQGDYLSSQFAKYFTLEYLLVFVLSVVNYFLAYAAVSAFICLYEEQGSSEMITPGAVWTKMMENIGSSIGAVSLGFVLTLIGLIVLFIPGIYLSIALQFSLMIVIRERLTAVEALKRSQKLIRDKWWSTFGLIMIMSMVTGMISIVFQAPTIILTMMKTLGLGGVGDMKVWMVIAGTLSVVGSTIVQGLLWVALAFQYYNLVEREGGSGLIAEIDALGS